MEIERQRGISVSTSVLAFNFNDKKINILDTPGHKDFAEDTYRTLTAVDSVIVVIDVAKGVEEQTEKLVKVCRMREIPIMVFINKLDREGKDAFGFNAANGDYGDMIEMGIWDPAKVTRTALQAAGSIAGMMITTEAMVTELPKDEPAAPAMPDMGGMGGMPGMM